MKRKIGLVILTAALAAACAVGLAACGDEQNKPCAEHTWDGGKVTHEATCAEAGETTYTCTVCGETKTEEIAKSTTHTWDEGEVDQPDITVEGTITYTCTVCGDSYSESVPAHVEHEWDEGSQLKAPTCGEKGSMKYECEVCHITKTEEIPATGEHHFDTFVGTVEEPTCVKAGSALYRCTDCGETTEKPVEATGKHALEWAFEGAEHWQECSNDGCTYATQKTPHGEDDWTQTNRREADCANDGRVDYACVCGATKYETLPSTGNHNYELKQTTKEATCGEAGSGLFECSGCHNTQTREIPATGKHTYEPKFNDSQHYTECSVCHGETARENHSLVYVADRQATVYETGTRHKACSGCGYRENNESYELDNFVSDYRKGVTDNGSGWAFGKSEYAWNGDKALPGNEGKGESFTFTEGAYNNNADDPAWEIDGAIVKAGWVNGSWVSMAYTVGDNAADANYTLAFKYKYNPHESHAGHYTKAVIRIVVLDGENGFKQGIFIDPNDMSGAGENGSSLTREVGHLNAGDRIFILIDFNTEGGSWTQGDFTCRIFEKQPEQTQDE